MKPIINDASWFPELLNALVVIRKCAYASTFSKSDITKTINDLPLINAYLDDNDVELLFTLINDLYLL
jgi:hypothetical protein